MSVAVAMLWLAARARMGEICARTRFAQQYSVISAISEWIHCRIYITAVPAYHLQHVPKSNPYREHPRTLYGHAADFPALPTEVLRILPFDNFTGNYKGSLPY
ncbi:hypothetical protein BDR03DRAFT_89937 [Suillus americanus]|nr:hypothetical protein BDR03DRAFT_89937 [Suillus americanus]